MPWVLVALVSGVLIAVGTAVFVDRNRDRSRPSEMTSKQWFILGISFVTIGLGTSPTLGLGMVGFVVAGVIYLAIGIRAQRVEGGRSPDERHSEQPTT